MPVGLILCMLTSVYNKSRSVDSSVFPGGQIQIFHTFPSFSWTFAEYFVGCVYNTPLGKPWLRQWSKKIRKVCNTKKQYKNMQNTLFVQYLANEFDKRFAIFFWMFIPTKFVYLCADGFELHWCKLTTHMSINEG